MLGRRLSGGRRRAERLGLQWERVTGSELAAKLDDRRTEDDELLCYECACLLDADENWHLDHVDPLALGGPHLLWNLETLCKPCNLRKGKRPASRRGMEILLRTHAARPHVRLRDRTVEALWEEDLRAGRSTRQSTARQFARRPRRTADVRDWNDHGRDIERLVVAALLRLAELDGDRNIWRARAISSLRGVGYPGLGHAPKGGALLTNYWARLMGLPDLSTVEQKGFGLDEGLRPSDWFRPVRAPYPDSGSTSSFEVEGFRLRFNVTRSDAVAFALEGSAVAPTPGRVPDVDQLFVP